MKKALLSTTAMAVAGAIASPASAAEWNMRAGGFMEQYVGYVDIDTVPSDHDGVSVDHKVFRGSLDTTLIGNRTDNDAQRFTYFTPRFSGFQLGASYARDGFLGIDAQTDTDAAPSDIFDVGASYTRSFGDAEIAVSGRWGVANVPGGPDPDIWSAGAKLGYAGFRIGGSYAEQNDAGIVTGEVWDLGVSYETGPWGVSFTFLHGENIDDENPGFDEEVDQFLLGLSYKVATGVDLSAYGAYIDFDEERSDSGGDDIDAWVIGTAIRINF